MSIYAKKLLAYSFMQQHTVKQSKNEPFSVLALLLFFSDSNFAINVGGLAYSTSSVKYDMDNQSASTYTLPVKPG